MSENFIPSQANLLSSTFGHGTHVCVCVGSHTGTQPNHAAGLHSQCRSRRPPASSQEQVDVESLAHVSRDHICVHPARTKSDVETLPARTNTPMHLSSIPNTPAQTQNPKISKKLFRPALPYSFLKRTCLHARLLRRTHADPLKQRWTWDEKNGWANSGCRDGGYRGVERDFQDLRCCHWIQVNNSGCRIDG